MCIKKHTTRRMIFLLCLRRGFCYPLRMSQDIKLYNSLTRQKEVFEPIDAAHIRVYACGPTVYNYAHIGNARMAVIFDLWVRVLRHAYPKVTYVTNITDIEDKIIDAAKAEGKPIAEITQKYTNIYNQDMASLNVLPPDIQPLATGHIPEMIALIEALINDDKAYENDGHVLFNVPAYANYGALSGRSRDEQIAGARVEVAPYKKDPADFVLWKPSTPDQPGWDSPWGRGRPGWHIECSAMAEKHLKLPFDIHGGGADLKFPHHENEIAQSCAAHNTAPEKFAKYWVHNGFVMVEGQKMSKSLSNVKLVHDMVHEAHPEIIRLTLLSSHYRQPLDYTENSLEQNKKLLDKIYKHLLEYPAIQTDQDNIPTEVLDALYDDLNTPALIAILNQILKNQDDPQKLSNTLKRIGNIIGLFQEEPQEWFKNDHDLADIDKDYVDNLLIERTKARAEKNFKRADMIRDELAVMGIEIEDTPDGPKWKKV